MNLTPDQKYRIISQSPDPKFGTPRPPEVLLAWLKSAIWVRALFSRHGISTAFHEGPKRP